MDGIDEYLLTPLLFGPHEPPRPRGWSSENGLFRTRSLGSYGGVVHESVIGIIPVPSTMDGLGSIHSTGLGFRSKASHEKASRANEKAKPWQTWGHSRKLAEMS